MSLIPRNEPNPEVPPYTGFGYVIVMSSSTTLLGVDLKERCYGFSDKSGFISPLPVLFMETVSTVHDA